MHDLNDKSYFFSCSKYLPIFFYKKTFIEVYLIGVIKSEGTTTPPTLPQPRPTPLRALIVIIHVSIDHTYIVLCLLQLSFGRLQHLPCPMCQRD